MTKFQDHCSNTITLLTNRLASGNVADFIKPWLSGPQGRSYPRSVSTGRPYLGLNSLMLAFNGYSSPWYLTFKQVKNLGGSVRKGEKATTVFFWKWLHKEEEGEVKQRDLPRPSVDTGMGLERLAMLVLGLDDIRQLYLSDLEVLSQQVAL